MLTAAQAVLKVDIDYPRLPTLRRIMRLCQRAGVRIVWLAQRRSPGGKGWHLWLSVTPRPSSAMEVVALECILGGDPFRQAVSVQRARIFQRCPPFMRDRWNVLYAKDKARARRVRLSA